MKKNLLLGVCLFFATLTSAQEIISTVMTDDNGKTVKKKQAKYLTVIKKISDGEFQRLNYLYKGALQSMQTYSDAGLTILEGYNLTYTFDGRLTIVGYYSKNKKDRDWNYYNDTFKVVKKETYVDGNLLKTIDPDTVQRTISYGHSPDEKEATFIGGNAGWSQYLRSTLNADVTLKSVSGGKVLVAFTINTKGYGSDIYLRRSVEFVLDEEALRVIYMMPRWEPAEQRGKKVNAYRNQPINFALIK